MKLTLKVRGRLLSVLLLSVVMGCNDQAADHQGTDTLPGVVMPPPPDTSAVHRPPPVGDSNAINTDSTGISR